MTSSFPEKTSSKFSGIILCFKLIAFLEALSWIALVIAMYYQIVLDNPAYIHSTGMIHGCIFILFVIGSFWLAKIQHWPLKILLWALISSILPLCSAIFEIIIARKGYLTAQ